MSPAPSPPFDIGLGPTASGGAAGSPFPSSSPSLDPFGSTPAAAPDPFAAAKADAGAAGQSGETPAADPFASLSGGDPFGALGAGTADANASANANVDADAAPRIISDSDADAVDDMEESGLQWNVRLADGTVHGPLSTDEVKERIRSGEVEKDAEIALGEGAYIPVAEKRIFGPTLRIAEGKLAPDRNQAQGASVKERSKAPLYFLLFLMLLGGAVVALFVARPEWLEGSSIGDDFVRQAALWRLQFPDVEGTSEEHFRKGRKLYLEDTALGYRLADEEFRKALLLDSDNLDAIAAFAENLARLPGLQQRVMDIKTAYDGLAYAGEKDPALHTLPRARGALLMASGDIQKAQFEFEEALRLEPTDAEALLLLAETDVTRDNETAVERAKQARKLDSTLKRADLIMGRARAEMGEFRQGLSDLERRVEQDPDHVETLIEIAQVYLKVGAYRDAVSVLERVVGIDGENRAARRLLGVVYYQFLGDLRNADLQLTLAAESLESEERVEEARDILSHLSHVRARRNKWEEAEEVAKRALGVDSAYPAAHFALGVAQAKRGAHDEAAKHFGRVIQATRGSYLEAPARTALADSFLSQGKYAEALQRFKQAIESDPRYARAFMGMAAAYARLNDAANLAMAVRRLIDLDPEHTKSRAYLAEYPQDQRDLAAYRTALGEFKGGPDDDSMIQASMAIVSFYLGDLRRAESHGRLAIREDSKNAGALLFLGAAALRRGVPSRAIDYLRRAHSANRLHSVTKYMLGKALLSAGKVAEAAEMLEELHDNDPNFTPALCALGDIAYRRKDIDRARELYTAAFKADVDLLSAKRGLFLVGQ